MFALSDFANNLLDINENSDSPNRIKENLVLKNRK